MNTQTMLELADDIADIPHEVNLTPRQARLLQAAANRLRETAALAGKPGAAQDQLSRLRQAILDNTTGDGFWLGEILLAVLEKETGFNGAVTRPDERCRYCDEAIEPGHDCSVTRPERCTPHE